MGARDNPQQFVRRTGTTAMARRFGLNSAGVAVSNG